MIGALLGLALVSAPQLVISSDGCPDATAIHAHLRSAGNEMMGQVITEASVLFSGGTLEVEAWAADGSLLGRKSVPAPKSCEHRAALVANLLETWSLSLTSMAFVPLEGFVPLDIPTATVATLAPQPHRRTIYEYEIREPIPAPIDPAPWIVLGLGAALLAGGVAANATEEPYLRTGDFIPLALYVSGTLCTVGALLAMTAR